MSFSLGLSEVSSWLARAAWSRSAAEGKMSLFNFGHRLRWCVPGFSSVKGVGFLVVGVVVDSVPPCRLAFVEGLAAQLWQVQSAGCSQALSVWLASPKVTPFRGGRSLLAVPESWSWAAPCRAPCFVIAEPDSVLLYFTLLSCHISPRKQATPLAVSAPALCLSKGFYCCDEINTRTKSNLQKEARAAAEAEANEEHFHCLAKLLHELLLKKMSTGLQASLPETAS